MDRFSCFTLGKIKRLLAQLRSAGFIVAKAYKNYDPRDRSLWYRITQKTAEHYTSLAEATAMQQKSKADSDTMLIYACALMDLDVTVLKAAMVHLGVSALRQTLPAPPLPAVQTSSAKP